MISICIPIYNQSVTSLVKELVLQSIDDKVEIEVLLIDDYSTDLSSENENRMLESIPTVRYQRLNENVGRSKIRNLFFKKASYQHLLFLDCDTFPGSSEFLKFYKEAILTAHVVVGGIKYRENLSDPSKRLRWVYGQCRETKNAEKRTISPYASFMTGNFMVDKSVFSKILFDEKISDYGHEDTLFGIELGNLHIPILHIDAPVYHEGLEDNELFILKTKQGIKNLLHLYLKHPHGETLIKNTSLLKSFHILKKMHLTTLYSLFFKTFEKCLHRKIMNLHPSMFAFDLYKLGIICVIYKKKEHQI